ADHPAEAAHHVDGLGDLLVGEQRHVPRLLGGLPRGGLLGKELAHDVSRPRAPARIEAPVGGTRLVAGDLRIFREWHQPLTSCSAALETFHHGGGSPVCCWIAASCWACWATACCTSGNAATEGSKSRPWSGPTVANNCGMIAR